MLTKITISGYKSLAQTTAILGPFTTIVGRNNVGKSNLFDALHLLSDLSRMSASEAFKPENHRGDPIESFFAERDPHISLEAEFDLTGRSLPYPKGEKLSSSLLIYQVELGFLNNLVVLLSERLTAQDEQGRMHELISVEPERTSSLRVVSTAENGARVRLFSTPMPKSILTMIDDAELYPYTVLLAEELRSWRFFHLEPEAMRESSLAMNIMDIEPNGRGLSGVFGTLQQNAPDRFKLAEQALRRAIPEVAEIRVLDTGDRRRLLAVVRQDGREFTARVLSDGMLRFLALIALAYLPEAPGLVCFEEPENGMHPGRLPFVVDLLRGISQRGLEGGRRSQVLVNSHSPYLVDLLEPDEMLVASLSRHHETHFASVGHDLFTGRPALKAFLESDEQTLGELWSQGSFDGDA